MLNDPLDEAGSSSLHIITGLRFDGLTQIEHVPTEVK